MQVPSQVKTGDQYPLSVLREFAAREGLDLIVSPESPAYPAPHAFLTSRDGKTEIKLVRQRDYADPWYGRVPFFQNRDKYRRIAAEFKRCSCASGQPSPVHSLELADADFEAMDKTRHNPRHIYALAPCKWCGMSFLLRLPFGELQDMGISVLKAAAKRAILAHADPQAAQERLIDLYAHYTGVRVGHEVFKDAPNPNNTPKPAQKAQGIVLPEHAFGVWF